MKPYKYDSKSEMLKIHKCCVAARSGEAYSNFNVARQALSRQDLMGFKIAEIGNSRYKQYYLVPPIS